MPRYDGCAQFITHGKRREEATQMLQFILYFFFFPGILLVFRPLVACKGNNLCVGVVYNALRSVSIDIKSALYGHYRCKGFKKSYMEDPLLPTIKAPVLFALNRYSSDLCCTCNFCFPPDKSPCESTLIHMTDALVNKRTKSNSDSVCSPLTTAFNYSRHLLSVT